MSKCIQFNCCAALVFSVGCKTRRESFRKLPSLLSTAVWRTHDGQPGLTPNFAPTEIALLPELRRKDDFGITVSGGGIRAAVAALGQFGKPAPQQLSALQANSLAQFAVFCVKGAGPEIKVGLG